MKRHLSLKSEEHVSDKLQFECKYHSTFLWATKARLETR
jgi:hypothetical protein